MSRLDKLSYSAVLAILMAAPFAQAEDVKPDNEVTGNLSAVSEYRYRGLSQTRFSPALQGGLDYVHNPTGLYIGTWLSSIHWPRDMGGEGHVEWDVYGGKKGQITEQIGYDVGALYYWYPENNMNPSANTFELYGQLSYGPAYVKYSHSTTDLFGTPDSHNSGYLDVGANVELTQGFSLQLHVGRQDVRHNNSLSYTDYKLGVAKDMGDYTIGLAFVKAATHAYLSPSGRKLSRPVGVLSLTKTF